MKRCYWFLIFSLFSLSVAARTAREQDFSQMRQPLSPQAQISLLTCSPSDDAVFTLYGHTALRVYDPATKTDKVYNYGTFDFTKPDFLYRFVKGEADYMLGANYFNLFLAEYQSRGSEVYEQVLNLLPKEKESLWQALEWNALPENRVYRYNFFFDNCATRPLLMIENNIQGHIRYAPTGEKLPVLNNEQAEQPAFREVINYCTRNRPWQTFGCDLVLGLPTDRMMTLQETFFIPDYLKNAFEHAEIVREGQSVPLVKQSIILIKENQIPVKPSIYTSPLFCFSLLFILLLVLTFNERRRKIYFRWVDIILFFAAGIAGCILFFLSFISVHPSIFPNISVLWLHPLHLIGIFFFAVKKWNMLAFWYHLINFAVIIIMCVGWFFIPQHFNIAFTPLILSLLLRSGGALLRKKESIG